MLPFVVPEGRHLELHLSQAVPTPLVESPTWPLGCGVSIDGPEVGVYEARVIALNVNAIIKNYHEDS